MTLNPKNEIEIEELVTIMAATRFRKHLSTHRTGAPQMFPKTPDDKHRNDFNLFYFVFWA